MAKGIWGTRVMITAMGALLPTQVGGDADSLQSEEGPDATATVSPTLLDQPVVRLPAPKSFADESSYLDTKTSECQRLADLADGDSDAMAKARYLLAAANTMLSYLVEPACSRVFLDLDTSAVDMHELNEVFDRVEALLVRAEDTLRQAESDDDKVVATRRNLLRGRETLQAFHGALKIFLVNDGGGDATKSKRRRAASKLSPLLEDDSAKVVAAARMWQAVLRQESDSSERLLQLLRPVMADIVNDSTHAFYSRLLSCRIMGESREFVSAVALLMQLETRCDRWFANEADRANAVRAVALFELRLVAEWYHHLKDDEKARAWCIERIQKIKDTHFSDGSGTVLRLSPAVPIVVTSDDRDRRR